MKLKFSKKGQVWVETVIYTLIAFVMIGLILSYARPKLEQLQDETILQQSSTILKQIDSTILTLGTEGNQRILSIGIKKGVLKLDAVNELIIFEIESTKLYSEPGKRVEDGNIIIYTEKKSGYNLITLTRNYSEKYDLKIDGKDELKAISPASTSYELILKNEGEDASEKMILNLSIS